LSSWAKPLVAIDPLAQLTGSACTSTAVRQRKVVEHEQLAGLQVHFDFDLADAETMPLEEREFGAEAVELRTAEKARIALHARKTW
jgi:hypothetical protein